MTWWMNAAQYATEILALVLIVRLLMLRDRREGVYIVFARFLSLQLLMTAEYLIFRHWHFQGFDYRILWMITMLVLWIFSLLLVYSLARAVLAELPGVLRLSRNLLNFVFPISIGIGLATVGGEYWVAGGGKFRDPIDRLVIACLALDRAIATAALLVLIVIVAFILWFPVKMPRNLAVFCVGLVVYFTSKTGLELLLSYSRRGSLQHETTELLTTFSSVVIAFCFLYWIIYIDAKGQTSQVRIGHIWRSADQNRLIQQLESLNVALMRNSERLEL